MVRSMLKNLKEPRSAHKQLLDLKVLNLHTSAQTNLYNIHWKYQYVELLIHSKTE